LLLPVGVTLLPWCFIVARGIGTVRRTPFCTCLCVTNGQRLPWFCVGIVGQWCLGQSIAVWRCPCCVTLQHRSCTAPAWQRRCTFLTVGFWKQKKTWNLEQVPFRTACESGVGGWVNLATVQSCVGSVILSWFVYRPLDDLRKAMQYVGHDVARRFSA